MTSQRNKLWSTIEGSINVSAAGAGGGQAFRIGANLLTGLGMTHLAGWTIGPTFLTMMIRSDGDNAVAAAVQTVQVGVVVADGGADDDDFPDLSFGDGDYFLRHTFIFESPGVVSSLVLPTEKSVQTMSSRSSRRLERIGDTLFLVIQQNTANDYVYTFSCTFMAMAP